MNFKSLLYYTTNRKEYRPCGEEQRISVMSCMEKNAIRNICIIKGEYCVMMHVLLRAWSSRTSFVF